MPSSRPSRFLAPLALLAAVAAVLFVFASSTNDEDGGGGGASTEETREAREAQNGGTGTGRTGTGTGTTTNRPRKTYTVRPGDTLGIIAERTGVSVEELEELNPDIDPNSLTVGDKIKLTE